MNTHTPTTAEANAGVLCHYQIQGQGPALYLVHGIGARASTWDAIIAELSQHFTCVSYDLRGHGASPKASLPYNLDQLVADLETLRAHLGHQQIHIAGHSLGGMIGPAYARAYPQHTLSVALLSTAAGRNDEDRAKLQAVGDAMHQRGVIEVLSTFVERWYTDDFIAAQPERIAARLQQVKDTPEAVFMSVFWIYAHTEMAPWLSEITCPCLVLTGALDGACNPRLNRFMAAQLNNAELVILDDLKHSILMEAPALVAQHVQHFLLNLEHG